jgi:hypothetical protein
VYYPFFVVRKQKRLTAVQPNERQRRVQHPYMYALRKYTLCGVGTHTPEVKDGAIHSPSMRVICTSSAFAQHVLRGAGSTAVIMISLVTSGHNPLRNTAFPSPSATLVYTSSSYAPQGWYGPPNNGGPYVAAAKTSGTSKCFLPLQRFHPTWPLPTPTPPVHGAHQATVDNAAAALKAFPPGTAGGQDGLRGLHDKHAFMGGRLIPPLWDVANRTLSANIPLISGSSPLPPHYSPWRLAVGGLRPIAMGSNFCRLVSTVALAALYRRP